MHDGDASSVPYLERALRGQPPGDVLECTWWHGQRALALTQARVKGEASKRASKSAGPS
jgi:hypothetical protein